jgi:hypothetical protein
MMRIEERYELDAIDESGDDSEKDWQKLRLDKPKYGSHCRCIVGPF